MPRDVLHLLPGSGRRRRGAGQGSAHRRRRLHRLERDGLGDPAGAGRAPRRHRAVHRRDRRPQRHDRGFQRAARAGGARRRALGLRQRRASAARRRACCSCRRTSPTAMIDMLVGAIEALDVGDPFDYATDIGPVIDEDAQDRARRRTRSRMQREGARARRPAAARELPRRHLRDAGRLRDRQRSACSSSEVFGPILHVVRYRARPPRQGGRRHQRHAATA